MDKAAQFVSDAITEECRRFAVRRKRDKSKAIGLQIATVSLSACITVLLGLSVSNGLGVVLRNIALGLGALITVLSAYDAFYDHRGLWVQRSVTLERLNGLRRELTLEFIESTDSTRKGLDDERAAYYLRKLNQIIEQDRREWLKIRSSGSRSAKWPEGAEEHNGPLTSIIQGPREPGY